jgi:hypothetical protein
LSRIRKLTRKSMHPRKPMTGPIFMVTRTPNHQPSTLNHQPISSHSAFQPSITPSIHHSNLLKIRSCCAINPGFHLVKRGPNIRGSCVSGCRCWGGISHQHALYLEGHSKVKGRELGVLSRPLAGPSCHTRTERNVSLRGRKMSACATPALTCGLEIGAQWAAALEV